MLYPTELRAVNRFGRGEEIRTPDILLPKQARYQTALHPARGVDYSKGKRVRKRQFGGKIVGYDRKETKESFEWKRLLR